jgi:hypothetical protein
MDPIYACTYGEVQTSYMMLMMIMIINIIIVIIIIIP